MKEILHQTTLQMPFCHFMEQEFLVVQNCGASCTIVGRYLTTTDDMADHRSYAVNPMYVFRIRQFQVILSDGTSLPIPAKRYTEVRDMLMTSISPSQVQESHS